MLLTGFATGVFAANCYVLAEHAGTPESLHPAVIIDPGQDATDGIEELVRQHFLKPVAVLLTHGHLDHTWTTEAVCNKYGIPAYIHPADRPMLANPAVGIGPALQSLIGSLDFAEPTTVIELLADAGDNLELAGLTFTVNHAPGHSPGSIIFGLQLGEQEVRFVGDVLFAGSIGRTDLPGGNHAQLIESIRKTLLGLPPQTVVLPGHGGQTTIAAERLGNPFLTEFIADSSLPSLNDFQQDLNRVGTESNSVKGRGGL